MTLTAPAMATGSTLVTVDHHRLVTGSRRLLVWVAGCRWAGMRRGAQRRGGRLRPGPGRPPHLERAGLVLMSAGEDELADPILQAHHDALTAVAVEFGCAIGAEAPSMVGHAYDSARQPWSHAHLVYGALAATNHGFIPLDPGRVAEQAERHIFGYQLLVRRAVTELVGPSWAWAGRRRPRMACEVTGLPARALQSIEQPCRPLSEIGACFDSREPR